MEAVSPPRIVADRLSQSALLQGRSRQTDRSLQGTLRDDHTGPQGVEQFLFAHNPILVFDEMPEQVKNQGLQGNFATLESQGAAVSIEFESRETMDACCHRRFGTMFAQG